MSTNMINGLFAIPDEASFLKKLILSRPTTENGRIPIVVDFLKQNHPDIELVKKDHYYALMLPTHSAGVRLEAMLITTLEGTKEYFSIYHRLHFEEGIFNEKSHLIEADAFLRMGSVIVNAPVSSDLEKLAYLLNYQIEQAPTIEVTMLMLSDAKLKLDAQTIVPHIMNATARLMLASSLDGMAYERPQTLDDMGRLVSVYSDIPLVEVLESLESLDDWQEDLRRSEEAFVAEYAASTSCLMFYLLDAERSEPLLDQGFAVLKQYLIDNAAQFNLLSTFGAGSTLGQFQQVDMSELRTSH